MYLKKPMRDNWLKDFYPRKDTIWKERKGWQWHSKMNVAKVLSLK